MPTLEKLQTDRHEHVTEQEVHQREIAELEGPLEKILERIGSESFDLIVGDDASGRIPTLILSRFFRAKAEKEGSKIPKTIFIAGGTRIIDNESRKSGIINEKKTKIAQLLEKQKKPQNGINAQPRVLIVTEIISTGDTLQPLVETLKERGFDIRIATVAILREASVAELKRRFNLDITYGEIGEPQIHSEHRLGGVERIVGDKSEIHSRPTKKKYVLHGLEKTATEIQKTINLSREDANIITERLIEKFSQN